MLTPYEPVSNFLPLCAVVVTYHPGESVLENLQAMVRECGPVLVVDNGSAAETCALLAAVPGVDVLALGHNLGVAAALNRGMQWAEAKGFSWVVTFDQDSRPEPGFGAALVATGRTTERLAVVGPQIMEEALARPARWLRVHPRSNFLFQRVSCAEGDLSGVSFVLTSGAMTAMPAWQALGGFDEKLFIDFVDTDFCLRAREAGWDVRVSAAAQLRHQLGGREKRTVMGQAFFPTHHPALRHYYISRNRIPMLLRHARHQPHWAAFELVVSLTWFSRMLVFERSRLKKIRAILLGTWDGLRGRGGPCPKDRLRGFAE